MDTLERLLDSIGEEEQKSVLIGNGFSMGFDLDVFGYEALLEEAEFLNTKADIRQVFKELDTSDFEAAIGGLDRVKSINNLYGVELAELEASIGKDQKTIRDSFLTVLSDRHPDSKSDFVDYPLALDFLTKFSDVFTTNYDLLLYWLRLDQKNAFTDGCGREELPDKSRLWTPDGWQNIHHLHGNFCLYEHERGAAKLVSRNGCLMQQLKSRLSEGNLPLVVFEGNSDQKRQRIESNQYLRSCHSRLRDKEGCLFTYGFAFSQNDQHIVEQLCAGKLEALHIGVFEPSEKDVVQAMLEKTRKSLGVEIGDMPNVGFYDSKKVDLWASPSGDSEKTTN